MTFARRLVTVLVCVVALAGALALTAAPDDSKSVDLVYGAF